MERQEPARIYGLIGYPARHSLSPLMHNAAFRALKLNSRYLLFEVRPEELEDFLLGDAPVEDTEGEAVLKSDIYGFNITIPHKVRARQILKAQYPDIENALSEEDAYYVKLSGAVNTVKRQEGKCGYFNTDAPGFLKSLQEDLKFSPRSKKVLVIGSGGAGRAVISALSWQGAGVEKIYVHDIRQEAMDEARRHFLDAGYPEVIGKLTFVRGKDIPAVIEGCALLVNASPMGMKGDDVSVIDKGLLHKGLSVYDVVYNRQHTTALIRDALSLRLPAADGLGMLLQQGAYAFGRWMGCPAPMEEMRKALALKKEVKR
ncbi:MAG: shikimate dehydrogenase [Candidatus Omnitrophota bacterium]